MQSCPFTNLRKGPHLTSNNPDAPCPNEHLEETLPFFFGFLAKTPPT